MLKSFDFFRKIQTDQQLTSTTGGIFTVFSLLFAIVLIIYSVQDFYLEKYFTFLEVRIDQSDYLPMKIDIILDKMPCQAIEIQFHDELDYFEKSMQSKLTMYKIDKNNLTQKIKYIRSTNKTEQKKSLQQGLEKQFMCGLVGILGIPKTPGKLSILPTAQSFIIQQIPHNLVQKVRMSYKINKLEFGLSDNKFDFPIAHNSKHIQNYIKILQGNIKNLTVIQDYTTSIQKLDYYSHIKIIPIILEQQLSNKNQQNNQKYRYSLRSSTAKSYQQYQKIIFQTQIQPINIVYKKHIPSLYSFIVKLLAVVGGTVATIGIINSISHFLFHIK